uniref:Uncharacterized protein n=1 Tax=Mycena chlorophos TaxID=658473 RepID=A0ABQ0L915_MYCCL|nr:predicted protein [Mycena chlorophos]
MSSLTSARAQDNPPRRDLAADVAPFRARISDVGMRAEWERVSAYKPVCLTPATVLDNRQWDHWQVAGYYKHL